MHLTQWFRSLWYTLLLDGTLAYNFDINSANVYGDPKRSRVLRGSYFGFSVALYTGGGSEDLAKSLILVGAPRANASRLESVIEPGTVYKCPIEGACEEWIVDTSQNGQSRRNSVINQIKDNAWTGATIAIENSVDPKVVVCAPRWKNNVINRYRSNWFMNGICYWTVADTAKAFEREAENEILPLLSFSQQTFAYDRIGFYNFGMGQTGFSLHMISERSHWNVALGSPGIYNWRGTPLLSGETRSGYPQNIVPDIKSERYLHSHDYFGYAVTSGCYFIKGERWYASGAPRSANMNGRVFIFSFPVSTNRRLYVRKTLEGKQYGEYFGSALASCDLNNDGRDDLIVGAPQWSKDTDEGRIYVFQGKSNDNFEVQQFDGEIVGGKLGSAITCLGDVDHDNYADIAVGAPYEDDHGAVYIFNGNKNGLSKKYSQRIFGSHFSQGIRGFGISITEPRDIDGNGYSDIAVGAYLSGHVILLRSKPVVTVKVNIVRSKTNELQRNSTSFSVNVCSFYNGTHVPEILRVTRVLKVDAIHGRAIYDGRKSNDGSYELVRTLNRGKNLCDEIKIHLKDEIENVVDPIEVSVTLNLKSEVQSLMQDDKTLSEHNFCPSCPVINKVLSRTEDSLELPFAIDCGEDNVCTSDIGVTITTDLQTGDRYVIGSTSTLRLVISIRNHGEPAYQAQTAIDIPEPLSLASMPPECTESSRVDNNTSKVVCDVGNPLRTNKTLTIELDARGIRSDVDKITLLANVSTQSEDTNLVDNAYSLTIYFDVEVDITIAGKAQEDSYSYFRKDGEERLKTIRFQHVYEVQKFGVSPIDEAALIVSVPTHWSDVGSSTEIIKVNQTIGYMEGRPLYCTDASETKGKERFDRSATTASFISDGSQDIDTLNEQSLSARIKTSERFAIIEDDHTHIANVPPDNRTLYVNCTNPLVQCASISCTLGAFVNSLSVAKVVLTLDLQLLNFKPTIMEEKDIIFFVSKGEVTITEPRGIVQIVGDKSDITTVGTTFIGSARTSRVAVWIIALSVILGIILLVLLTLGLIKAGFFDRKKKTELEALKAETDREYGIVLKTSSSREILDRA